MICTYKRHTSHPKVGGGEGDFHPLKTPFQHTNNKATYVDIDSLCDLVLLAASGCINTNSSSVTMCQT